MVICESKFYRIMKQLAPIAISFIRNNNIANYKALASVLT